MSDTSQGDGWWLASDGKWYPPSSAPGPAPTPAPPAYGQAPSYGQAPGQMPVLVAPTANEAVWSLVLGILSVTCLGLLAGIPAVILGTIAKRKILASGGMVRGQGLATAGVVLGSVSIGFSLVFIALAIFGAIGGSGSSSGALGF